MRDDDELLSTPGLSFGSGVIGVCDICHKRQAVVILQKERFQLCVIDFLNKTFVQSKEKPGRPLPLYRSERIWFATDANPSGQAPAIVLTPTKAVRRPVVLVTPDVYGLTTTLLDGAIRLAREGFEVLLPDVGKTSSVGPADHLSLRRGAIFGRGVGLDSGRVRHLVSLYRDALKSLRSREMVDATKTGVFGTSYGGSLALALAAEDRQVSAVALAYPMPVHPESYVKLVTAPILAVFGDHDRAGARSRKQLTEAKNRGEISLELIDISGGGHNFLARDLRGYEVARAEAGWSRIVAFVHDRLLPPPPKPPSPPLRTAPPPVTPTPPAPTAPTAGPRASPGMA